MKIRINRHFDSARKLSASFESFFLCIDCIINNIENCPKNSLERILLYITFIRVYMWSMHKHVERRQKSWNKQSQRDSTLRISLYIGVNYFSQTVKINFINDCTMSSYKIFMVIMKIFYYMVSSNATSFYNFSHWQFPF